MNDQDRAVDFRWAVGEPKALQLLHRRLPCRHAHDAQQMLPRGTEGGFRTEGNGLAGLVADAPRPDGLVIIHRSPRHARLDSLFEGCGTGRIVAAHARRPNAHSVDVDVAPSRQVIDRGAHAALGVEARRQTADAQRRTLARTVHAKTGNAAFRQGKRGRKHLFLGAVESIGEDDHGGLAANSLCRNEVALQTAAFEWDIDDLDAVRRYSCKRCERLEMTLIGGSGPRIVGRKESLGPLVILRGPIESVGGRDQRAGAFRCHANLLDLLGQFIPGCVPSLDIAVRLLLGGLRQPLARPTDLAEMTATRQATKDGQRPHVVVWETRASPWMSIAIIIIINIA